MIVVTGDVSVEEDVVRGRRSRRSPNIGGVDVLINNAGIADVRGLAAENYGRRHVRPDPVGGPARCVPCILRECGKRMLAAGSGSIVNICSIMGSGANELNVIPYTAAKGGLRNMTLQLGCEWADRGVRVNSVSPGFILTDMIRTAVEGTPNADYIASRTPMRRMGEAQEVSNAVMFLASDMASYITGVDLYVDGWHQRRERVLPNPADPPRVERRQRHPMAEGGYEGLLPRPEGLEAMSTGIPGIHH